LLCPAAVAPLHIYARQFIAPVWVDSQLKALGGTRTSRTPKRPIRRHAYTKTCAKKLSVNGEDENLVRRKSNDCLSGGARDTPTQGGYIDAMSSHKPVTGTARSYNLTKQRNWGKLKKLTIPDLGQPG
jgi:hypothetical protein